MRPIKPRRRLSRRPAAAPPTPQALEQRVLLAAVLTPDGTLAVTGTDGADEVTVRIGSNPADVHVQEGTAALYIYARDRVRAIAIDLGAGEDVLHLDQANGLITGTAGGEITVGVNGGAGNDTLVVVGSPATGAVDQVLTIGPDAGGGTLVSRAAGGAAQTVRFSGTETLADTSAAASLTLIANDATGAVVTGLRNVIELSAGPLANGVTQTATARFYDATLQGIGGASAQPPASAAAQPASAGAAEPGAGTGAGTGASTSGNPAAAAADDASDPAARRRAKLAAKQAAKAAKREAQRQAKLARLEAQRRAREQRQAARRGGADAAALAAAAAGAERLAISATHLAVHFANKAAVTIQTGAADDRVEVNLPAAPAGLRSLTVDGGTGTDRLAEVALPAGVTVQRPNVEATSAARDWVLVNPNPTPPGPGPLVPNTPEPVPPPPAPVPGGGGGRDPGSSASTSSSDRDGSSSSGSASSSHDASASASASTSSRDADASGSSDRDTSSSRDASASGGD